jgi:hypothetical protein
MIDFTGLCFLWRSQEVLVPIQTLHQSYRTICAACNMLTQNKFSAVLIVNVIDLFSIRFTQGEQLPSHIYRAVSKQAAETALDELEERWGQKYPIVIKSWRNKWENLSVYFKYPEEIRRVIYTTNSIEAVHRQFRKLTKTKGGFPNENSLLKLLYLGIQNASKKWTMPIRNWNLALSQLAIFFDGRLDDALEL